MSLIPSFYGNRRIPFDPFSMDVWHPFEGSHFSRDTSAFAGARIDWKETDVAHVFKADVPGLKKEEVEVEDDRVLQISGERSKEHEEKTDKWHRVERSSGKFVRRFRLPENAKLDEVRAAMEHGVLTVTVPKVEAKRQTKSIDITESFAPPDASALAGARIEWKETDVAHIFKADVPGLKKEEAEVEVEDDRVLQISGERSKEHEEKTDKWHRVERSSGKFVRRFRLPENTKLDEVKAAMEHGVLTVTVPKVEAKRQTKSIDITG